MSTLFFIGSGMSGGYNIFRLIKPDDCIRSFQLFCIDPLLYSLGGFTVEFPQFAMWLRMVDLILGDREQADPFKSAFF